MTRHLRTPTVLLGLSLCGASCFLMSAPPALPELQSKPLSVRLFVFGADAEDAHEAVVSLKTNNESFAVVPDGGSPDVDVLIGLEKDSSQCVEPTALCSYRISYRIRKPSGDVLHAADATILADSNSCSSLCDHALDKVAARVIVDAATLAHGGSLAAPADGAPRDAAADPPSDAQTGTDAPTPAAPGSSADPASAKPPGTAPAASASEPTAAPPADAAAAPSGGKGLCSVASGPTLPAKEAEKRVAQVDALKRLGLIDEAEFDCLRKAYLDRL